ncbi:MAG: CRISPR system precrRNA processing endoribonuclease RAMP protein Cas6 [Candidatus Zhuqueibacterota bacterium]
MQAVKSNTELSWQEDFWNQKFTWAMFEFNIKAKETLYLPEYKGSTLRGGFGNTFRRVVCDALEKQCQICILNQTCPYAYIFETPNLRSYDIQHFADNYPHPFVIEPPLSEQKEYKAGEKLSFGLILIGKSIRYLPYFIYTFDQLGLIGLGKGRGKFDLISVNAIEDISSYQSRQIFDKKDQVLNGNFIIWDLNKLHECLTYANTGQIHIDIISPLRIILKKQLIENVTFELLMRNLIRRVSMLGKIHCDSEWALNYPEIILQAKENVEVVDANTEWNDWERYSSRQKTRMKLGGITGRITFQGYLQPFLPFLILGQYVHVGKNTTFGLGKYKLSFGS